MAFRSAVITLLTDFGLQDEYVGVTKGVILQIHPGATLIDLSHQIPLGDVPQASWLLAWSWPYFPKGTIHLVVVDPGVGSSRRLICLVHQGHLFLAPDNGVLSQVVSRVRAPVMYEVSNRRYALKAVSHTFHGRDILAPAAAYLSRGLPPHRLGPRVRSLKLLKSPSLHGGPGRSVRGEIIHIDRFGNAVTNLPQEQVLRIKRPSRVELRVKGRTLRGLSTSYQSAAKGSPLVVVGSHRLVEIAVNQGSAAKKLGLRVGDPVWLR